MFWDIIKSFFVQFNFHFSAVCLYLGILCTDVSPAYVFISLSSFTISNSSQLELARKTTSVSNLSGQFFAVDIKDLYAVTVQSFQCIFQ